MNEDDNAQLTGPSEPRRWQYSLRTLLIVATSAAVLMSILMTPYLCAFFFLYSFVWGPLAVVCIVKAWQRKSHGQKS